MDVVVDPPDNVRDGFVVELRGPNAVLVAGEETRKASLVVSKLDKQNRETKHGSTAVIRKCIIMQSN